MNNRSELKWLIRIYGKEAKVVDVILSLKLLIEMGEKLREIK